MPCLCLNTYLFPPRHRNLYTSYLSTTTHVCALPRINTTLSHSLLNPSSCSSLQHFTNLVAILLTCTAASCASIAAYSGQWKFHKRSVQTWHAAHHHSRSNSCMGQKKGADLVVMTSTSNLHGWEIQTSKQNKAPHDNILKGPCTCDLQAFARSSKELQGGSAKQQSSARAQSSICDNLERHKRWRVKT